MNAISVPISFPILNTYVLSVVNSMSSLFFEYFFAVPLQGILIRIQ